MPWRHGMARDRIDVNAPILLSARQPARPSVHAVLGLVVLHVRWAAVAATRPSIMMPCGAAVGSRIQHCYILLPSRSPYLSHQWQICVSVHVDSMIAMRGGCCNACMWDVVARVITYIPLGHGKVAFIPTCVRLTICYPCGNAMMPPLRPGCFMESLRKEQEKQDSHQFATFRLARVYKYSFIYMSWKNMRTSK